MYKIELVSPKHFYPYAVKKWFGRRRGWREVFACDEETCWGYVRHQIEAGGAQLVSQGTLPLENPGGGKKQSGAI